ncbi:VanZ family protein [Chengkuizengella sediminis]|uniref:VanZ family protein n=1 Tax=Chengkuizengella sediminis TaxID=1885917 RepID=UPI001389B746|nr:VanZ family protein [Chengkuizengella sediminis]NDI35782.1 VanZ family protein [Chengkuizengella sediminis]
MIEYESLILFAIPWIVYRTIVFAFKKPFSIKTEFIKALFYFSIIFIYCLTIFPFPFYVYPYEKGNAFQLMNLIPFASIYGSLTHFYYMVPLRNIGGNILLFMPLGFAIPLRYKVNKLWKVMLIGLFISFTVEVVQLFISIRSFDVDDLILNTLGTIMGLIVYRLFILVTKSAKQKETIDLMSKT